MSEIYIYICTYISLLLLHWFNVLCIQRCYSAHFDFKQWLRFCFACQSTLTFDLSPATSTRLTTVAHSQSHFCSPPLSATHFNGCGVAKFWVGQQFVKHGDERQQPGSPLRSSSLRTPWTAHLRSYINWVADMWLADHISFHGEKKVSLHSLFIRRSRAKRIIQSGFLLYFF